MSIFSLPDDMAKSFRMGRQGKSASSGKRAASRVGAVGTREPFGSVMSRHGAGAGEKAKARWGGFSLTRGALRAGSGADKEGESSFAGAFASGVLKLVAYRPAPARPDNGMQIRAKKNVGPKIRTDVVSCCFREREKRAVAEIRTTSG